MKNEKIGFGDILLYSTLLMLTMKYTGILSASWLAICQFSFFVVAYLAIYFLLDVVIKVVDTVIAKKRDK
jgi:hypothetical protein